MGFSGEPEKFFAGLSIAWSGLYWDMFNQGTNAGLSGQTIGAPLFTFARGIDMNRRLHSIRAQEADFTLINEPATLELALTEANGLVDGVEFQATANVNFISAQGGSAAHDVMRIASYDLWQRAEVLDDVWDISGRGRWDKVAQAGAVESALYGWSGAGVTAGRGASGRVTTGDMINLTLDAISYPKTFQRELVEGDSLFTVAAYWGMGGTSPNSDLTGNVADGTFTAGGGNQTGDTLIDGGEFEEEGEGSATFDGDVTKFAVGDDADIQNIWDGGGTLIVWFRPDTALTDSTEAVLIEKGAWRLKLREFSAGSTSFNLVFEHDFSTQAGIWSWALVAGVTGGLGSTGIHGFVLTYDADSTANEPSFYRFGQLYPAVLLTTEQSPIGTRTTDVGSGVTIGNNPGQTEGFPGLIGPVALCSDIPTDVRAEVGRVIDKGHRAPRKIAVGTVEADYWWLGSNSGSGNAQAAVIQAVVSEGPGALLYEDAHGALTFRDNTYLTTNARSLSLQRTFKNDVDAEGPFLTEPPTRLRAELLPVNRAEMFQHDVTAAGGPQEVWVSPDTDIDIPSGGSVTMRVSNTDGSDAVTQGWPIYDIQTPTTGASDYTKSGAGTESFSFDRTSGASVLLTVSATGGSVQITDLRVRASATAGTDRLIFSQTPRPSTFLGLLPTTGVHQQADDAESQALYGVQELDTPPWPVVDGAEGFTSARLDDWVAYWATPRQRWEITTWAGFDERSLHRCLDLDIGDRVRFIDSVTGRDVQGHVFHIAMEIGDRLRDWTFRFGIEQAADIALDGMEPAPAGTVTPVVL